MRELVCACRGNRGISVHGIDELHSGAHRRSVGNHHHHTGYGWNDQPSAVAAAKIGGANRIFRVAEPAVAALAYGTETIPAVDKIVGPGNAFVAEAKNRSTAGFPSI